VVERLNPRPNPALQFGSGRSDSTNFKIWLTLVGYVLQGAFGPFSFAVLCFALFVLFCAFLGDRGEGLGRQLLRSRQPLLLPHTSLARMRAVSSWKTSAGQFLGKKDENSRSQKFLRRRRGKFLQALREGLFRYGSCLNACRLPFSEREPDINTEDKSSFLS
jgi:hypothetical protein